MSKLKNNPLIMMCPCCGKKSDENLDEIEALQRIDALIDQLSKSVDAGVYFTGVQYVLPKLIEARGKK